jgi:foldase protein PrsA
MNNLRRAQEVWNMYRANPTLENFAKLASEYSVDPGGKSLGGVVPPIQRHGGQKPLEDEAFKLKPGEHSGLIQIADKYVFLLCEGVTKPVAVDKPDVREVLYEDILEKKHRVMMARHFKKIVEQSHISTTHYPELSKKRGVGPEKRANRSAGTPFRG